MKLPIDDQFVIEKRFDYKQKLVCLTPLVTEKSTEVSNTPVVKNEIVEQDPLESLTDLANAFVSTLNENSNWDSFDEDIEVQTKQTSIEMFCRGCMTPILDQFVSIKEGTMMNLFHKCTNLKVTVILQTKFKK